MELLGKIELICGGLKVATLGRYRDVYLSYQYQKTQGTKKTDAITWVSDEYRISERYVYDAIKFFE